MAKDMRSWISQLDQAGELSRVSAEVDPETEMGNLLFTSREKALLFNNIKGHPGWKVLGQAPANWRQIGLAVGVETKKIVLELAGRIDNGLVKCTMVDSGPVKEIVLKGKDANLLQLPTHKTAEQDGGRYIAGGLCIVKDPETGIRNMAMHRLQVKDSNKLGVALAMGKHTHLIYEKYEAMNKPMPMAVVIGHHPMYYFAAPYTAPRGVDELEVAGALLGEPVELVKCETIDLEVPAYAEIVLECEVPPKIREEEGPFSEFTGYYANVEQPPRPVAIVKGIIMRKDAIYKVVQSSAFTESIYYNGLPMAVAIFRDLRNVGGYVDLKGVSCNWGSILNVVVQMTPRFYGEAKQVLLAAMSGIYFHQKICVAVDEDVDIYDPQHVAWAIATRVNPEVDIDIIHGVRGNPLDNALPEVKKPGVTWHRFGGKLLIDATKPPTSDPVARAGFDQAMPPSPEQNSRLSEGIITDLIG